MIEHTDDTLYKTVLIARRQFIAASAPGPNLSVYKCLFVKAPFSVFQKQGI